MPCSSAGIRILNIFPSYTFIQVLTNFLPTLLLIFQDFLSYTIIPSYTYIPYSRVEKCQRIALKRLDKCGDGIKTVLVGT